MPILEWEMLVAMVGDKQPSPASPLPALLTLANKDTPSFYQEVVIVLTRVKETHLT